MESETVRIHFLSSSTFFDLLSSRNFAIMVTWRNDFSSLLRQIYLIRFKGELIADQDKSIDLFPSCKLLQIYWISIIILTNFFNFFLSN